MSPPFIARALVEVDGIDGNYSSDVLAARPSRSVARRPRVAEFTTIQTANDEKKKSRLRDFLIFLSFEVHDSTTPPPRQVSRAFSPVRARDVDHARVADRCRAIARRVASRRVGTRRRARARDERSNVDHAMMRTTTATTRTTTRVAALGARATGRGRGRGRDARARASGDAQRAGADGDARDDARRGGATTRKNRRGLLGAGFAAATAGLTGLTRAANAAPTLPKELTEPDEIFREDFNVQFAGLTVDHKDLIYALVVGQTIGFVGSAVGGAEARKRAEEIERLNSTLLKVNKEVRKELRSSQGRKVAFSTMDSSDEASSETVLEIISLLKSGKSKLKAQASQEAKETFTKARQLIDANQSALKEPWKAVRKAERGLGAASARLGEYDEALSHMKTVLKLSTEHDDTSVATDACGIIADIYAEMDQIEVAADWYDKYFESLAIEDAKEAAEAGSSSAR